MAETPNNISEYLDMDDWFEVEDEEYQPPVIPLGESSTTINNLYQQNIPSLRDNEVQRVAFIVKSNVEVLDDGFKWRKYGKKKVKSSQNPRNYYKCCVPGCSVKKRIERKDDDPSYIVTTYEGNHNHVGPRN